jgi:ankyrin repeat protein
MTGVEERKARQKALKGLKCVALSKWPKHSNRNNFAGLRWGELRRIKLKGFKIKEMVDPKDPRRVYQNTGLSYFGHVCHLGHRDIALLMVKSGSVDINGKDRLGQTPLYHASGWGKIEVVQALVEAGADLNQAREDGATPLFVASQQGHLDVVKYLVEAGADLNLGNFAVGTPLALARGEGHKKIAAFLKRAGATA